jgi:hypothetical protein
MLDALMLRTGGTPLGPQAALMGIGALVVLLSVLVARWYWRWKLRTWGEGQGLQLVRFRWARFYEGPSAWMRSRNQHLFKAVMRDRQGLDRSCWIMFGTFWGFTWGEPVTHVEWTNDDN